MAPTERARRADALETGASFLLAAWLALFLVAGRVAVVLALELVHHGDFALARLRLAHGFTPALVGGVVIALAAALSAWFVGLVADGRLARVTLLLALAAATLVLLAGGLDPDPSRRIGTDTSLGLSALCLAAAVALALSAAFASVRLRRRIGPLAGSVAGASVAIVALGAGAYWVLSAGGRLGPVMDVQRVEGELHGAGWEVLRAHPSAAPRVDVLAPGTGKGAASAARPGLVMPPPARVRRSLEPQAAPLHLEAAAAVDASVAAAAERYPGHALRFRVSIDGRTVLDEQLPLAGGWSELAGGEGVELAGGETIELETALVDAAGEEVTPAEPLRAGFAGLELVRRARLARGRPAPGRPNVVLVVLDTLRADRTSAYGYARATTPNLDALARRGLLFEEASSTASWTWPSTASLLTGLMPEEHGVTDGASSFLPETLDTLAEALQRQGYTTAAFSGSPLIVPAKQFDQGFEAFDASREGNLRRSDQVVPPALDWLGAASEWRFFLYLHLMEPHAPYVPLPRGRELFAAKVPLDLDPRRSIDQQWELLREGFAPDGTRRTEEIVPPEEQRWISDLYDGCVWSADHWLGVVVSRLEELGVLENTIVAVTSDHGEELFDHGLLAHAHALHRELVQVPLVLAGPGIPRGERVSTPLSNAALGPTLARLCGSEIVGADPALDLLAPRPGPVLFSTQQGWWNGAPRTPIYGLRDGSSVLHFAPRGAPWGAEPSADGDLRLYDLARDPREHEDLAVREPERAARLRDELLRRLAVMVPLAAPAPGEPDAATLEMLRDLGYVR